MGAALVLKVQQAYREVTWPDNKVLEDAQVEVRQVEHRELAWVTVDLRAAETYVYLGENLVLRVVDEAVTLAEQQHLFVRDLGHAQEGKAANQGS